MMTREDVDQLTERRWERVLIERDGELLRVPVSVSVEVGAFRFSSSQGLPKGLVSSVLSTRKRRRGKFSQRKCAALMTLTGPRSSWHGRDRDTAIGTAQRKAYDRAIETGSWA